jgi:8-oxo-dGTP pyrophosphatase MutT (NUDIX family)
MSPGPKSKRLKSARSGVAQGRKAREERSAGGVVLRRFRGVLHVLLIKDPYGNWGLPKGHLEGTENPQEAGLREVEEETGLMDISLGPELRTIDWYFRLKGKLIHKHCTFFLMASETGDPVPQEAEGISACAWLPFVEAIDQVGYENAREVLIDAARIVFDPGEPLWEGTRERGGSRPSA